MNDRQQELLNRALSLTKETMEKWEEDYSGDKNAHIALASAFLSDATIIYKNAVGAGKTAMILYNAADRLAALNIKSDQFDRG